jgi:NAD(P)-dependent dehydrogenase (short-subunit alcohol dehydrogenase family)
MKGNILIYGGSGGIGSAIGRTLRERGYGLHLVGRDEDKLAQIANELDAGYTAGDVTDSELFPAVMEEVGKSLYGLVYAVGTINTGSLRRMSEADLVTDLRVNAVGAALAIQAALTALKRSKAGASVLLFSSVATLQGFKMHTSVGLSKGAINGLTLSLAAELAPRVRVNAIAPSLTRTPLADTMLTSEKIAETMAKSHPLPRLGQPEEIAALAAFLLSPQADWITGQIISIDGGRSTLRPQG